MNPWSHPVSLTHTHTRCISKHTQETMYMHSHTYTDKYLTRPPGNQWQSTLNIVPAYFSVVLYISPSLIDLSSPIGACAAAHGLDG